MEPGGAMGLWQALAATGGALALVFIVGLVIAMAAMTTVFLGSAVIVLERFARVSRSWGLVAGFALLVAASVATILVVEQRPELSVASWSEWFAVYRVYLARTVGICLIATTVAALGLRFTSSRRLVYIAVVWVGAAAALYLVAPPVLRLVLETPIPLVATIGELLGSFFIAVVVFGLLPLAAAGLVGMRKSAEWFIAVRYLVAQRRQVFISTITAICITGIAAGVWLIITVLSVMNGFERTWREEIIGNRAHFTVHSGFGPFSDYESVLKIVDQSPGVTAVSPYLDAEGMIRSRQGDVFAVRLRGVDPARVGRVTDLSNDMQVGALEDLTPSQERSNGDGASLSGIVIGNQLASAVGVGVGDPRLLISPYGGPPTPLGPAPRLKRFQVVGIFQSSFFQYDEVYTYTSLSAAQDFRKAGDVVDGLEARTTDLYRSRRVADEVVRTLEYPFYSRDWKEYFPAFFQALKTERVMMFILLSIVMVVAAFVVVATLIMMIMEKSSDIAILKAMGAEDVSIERIFALEGTLIGLAGTVLGVLAGVAVTDQLPWIQGMIERITGIDTLPPEIYQFSTLPSEMNPVDVVVIAT
ncbi:MAG: ABC transporter permease, partial [Myxococcota bacterium]|nr:ABC transporter permease [Myxococcota bacterium]